MQTLKDGWQIAWKDLLDFGRDRMRIISFIIMPVFLMIMTGYIFPSENALRDVSLAVVLEDQGAAARSVGQGLAGLGRGEGNPAMEVRLMESARQAREAIKAGEVLGAVVIPEGFSEAIQAGRQARVILVSDEANPQVSSLLVGALTRMLVAISDRMAAQRVEPLLRATAVPVNPTAAVRPFVVETKGVTTGPTNYFQFMAPGIMAMTAIMSVMMGLAGAISREREIGTLDGLLIAPISRLAIVLGKTISQSVRGLLQGAVVLILAVLLFHVTINGSLGLVALLLVLGIFSFTGLGILISAFASEQETAMTIISTLTFPMIFLSGAFFPIQQMPLALRYVSQAIPLAYAIDGLRKVIVLGAGISAIGTELLVLAAFGAVTLVLAVPVFNRVVTR